MNAPTDQQLLCDYAEHRSEAAFTALVRRHIDFVHSAAVRMTGEAQSAQDVTQAVFLALAQNAARLTDHPVLAGWLHTTARNLAAKNVRAAVRRQHREQEAAAMNELLSTAPDASWEEIAPQLDVALGELSEPERNAVLLRYFEKKSATEMSQILGISDEAAQKRVSRAVERLREFFSKRNVTVGTGTLAVLISANAVQSAPIGLVTAISTAALAGTAAVTSSTIITATKTIAMTTLQKAFVAATVAVLAGAGVYEARQATQLHDQVQILQQQQAPLVDQIRKLQSNFTAATNRFANLLAENARLKSNSKENELLKLRGQVGVLRRQTNQLAELESQIGLLQEQIQNLKTNQLSTSDKFELAKLHYGDAASAITVAAADYAKRHDGEYPTRFNQLNLSTTNFASDVELKDFEFENGTNSMNGKSFFFRVQVPIQNPDGNWVWIYGHEQDGHGSTEMFNISDENVNASQNPKAN